jgi:hypothetical protein
MWTDHVTQGTVETTPGLQNFFHIGHLTYNQIVNFRDRLIALRNNDYNSIQSYGGQVLRERLGTYSNRMQFLNSTNHPVQMVIYELACKHDLYPSMTWRPPAFIPGTPLLGWDGTPTGAFNQGILAEHSASDYASGAAVVGVVPTVQNNNYQFTARDYGVSPMSSAVFRDYFKVKKKMVAVLQPNEIHNHSVSISPNMMLDNLKLRTAGAPIQPPPANFPAQTCPSALSGQTVYTFVVFRGVVAKSSNANGTTTSGAGIDVLQTIKMSGSVITQIQRTRAAGNPFPFAVATQHINVVQGTAVRDVIMGDHAVSGPEFNEEGIGEPQVQEAVLDASVELPDPEDIVSAPNPPTTSYVPPAPP